MKYDDFGQVWWWLEDSLSQALEQEDWFVVSVILEEMFGIVQKECIVRGGAGVAGSRGHSDDVNLLLSERRRDATSGEWGTTLIRRGLWMDIEKFWGRWHALDFELATAEWQCDRAAILVILGEMQELIGSVIEASLGANCEARCARR